MSALTLLSAIAPAVPNVPQGSSVEAASDFRTLLAALSGEDAAVSDAKSPAEPPRADEAEAGAAVDAPAIAGFLAVPPATPLVLPAAEETGPATSVGAEGAADRADDAGADAPLPPPALADTVANRDGTQATTPLPADKGAKSRTVRPEVQPPLPDVRPVAEETSGIQLTLAETAAAVEAVEARARTGAAPAPSSPPPAAPPPLRALAERTSRPLEAPKTGIGDASRAKDPAQPAAVVATAAAPAAGDPPARLADFVVAPPARDASSSGEAERQTSDLSLSVEGTAAQTQATVAGRETGGSQLSRATIEATAQIAAQILRRLEGRSTRFEMALTPDELGRVDVKLDIDSEGRLNARLAFDNPAAATDLRGRADELRRQLEDAGFHLAEDAFEFTDRDSGSSAFDRGQDARNGSSRAFATASRLNTEADVAQPPLWMALTLSPLGVDMKV